MSATPKTNIEFNGRESAGADEIPVTDRTAYDRRSGETPVLHSGARLAAKLKAKIIVNDTEFNNPGEMSVDDRQLYHEMLEALFPQGIAVAVTDGGENPLQENVAGHDRGPRLRRIFLPLAARLFRIKR